MPPFPPPPQLSTPFWRTSFLPPPTSASTPSSPRALPWTRVTQTNSLNWLLMPRIMSKWTELSWRGRQRISLLPRSTRRKPRSGLTHSGTESSVQLTNGLSDNSSSLPCDFYGESTRFIIMYTVHEIDFLSWFSVNSYTITIKANALLCLNFNSFSLHAYGMHAFFVRVQIPSVTMHMHACIFHHWVGRFCMWDGTDMP